MQTQAKQIPATPAVSQHRDVATETMQVALSAQQLLQLQAELLGRKRFDEAATALAQQLASSLRCERVSIGWREKEGMSIVAASYVAEVHARQETARLVAAAMDEAAEQGATLVYPEPDGGKPAILLAHEEQARRQGYAICTAPLAFDGKIIGALTMERRNSEFSKAEAAHIERVVAMLAPFLALKYENGLPLWRRFSTSIREDLAALLNTGTPASKPIIAGIATGFALLALALLLPTSHNVSAPAELEGSIQRVLTAPTDGYLHNVYARPGDRVKAGQVLAELADQDMLVEQRGLEAELAQHENALISAQARSDRTEFIVNQGQADAIQAKLALLQQQLDRSRLRAPFDAVVIKGDLSQSVGAPVERGAELMTLAPDSGYRVMIEADESDIADLKRGQTGRLILAAMPSQTLPFRVERITPLATTEEGRHYFPVYAALEGKLPALRPGMKGFAKIDVDKRSMLINWVNRAANWVRIKLWSWGA
ncbi:MAG: HlyD family efflux transporter periplasmic adaptor subunit [Thiobacillaceae bacterium]